MTAVAVLVAVAVGLGVAVRLTAEPGPNAWLVLLQRYGWALLAACAAFAVFAGMAVLRPRSTAVVLLCAVPVGAAVWGATGRTPAGVARRAVLRSRWPSVARACGLANRNDRRSTSWPGEATSTGLAVDTVEYLPTLRRGRAVPGGVRYTLRPARGGTIEQVADAQEALAAGLHVGLVEVVRLAPDRGTLTVYWRVRS